MESLLGTSLTFIKPDQAEGLEKKLAGGRALSVRAMIARQMLFAQFHRKMKEHKQARS
jgi:hypothetical protein